MRLSVKRIARIVGGWALLAVGGALLVLPGPGFARDGRWSGVALDGVPVGRSDAAFDQGTACGVAGAPEDRLN